MRTGAPASRARGAEHQPLPARRLALRDAGPIGRAGWHRDAVVSRFRLRVRGGPLHYASDPLRTCQVKPLPLGDEVPVDLGFNHERPAVVIAVEPLEDP